MTRPNKRDYYAPSLGYFDNGTEELKLNINSYCDALDNYCTELEQNYADACIDYRQLMKLNKKLTAEKLTSNELLNKDKYPISLTIILTATENGFYQNKLAFQHRSGYLDPKFIRINLWDECLEFYDMWNGGDRYDFYFKDYKKTWALTKEELEEKKSS